MKIYDESYAYNGHVHAEYTFESVDMLRLAFEAVMSRVDVKITPQTTVKLSFEPNEIIVVVDDPSQFRPCPED